MPSALAATGVTTFATDASRQPNQYSLTSGASTATSAPRYPSNIYYNASNWTDELNEYNTLYVAPGTSLGDATYPAEQGHCASSSATTCLSTPATESSLLASESRIMLSHVLANNPRVGYAHQTNLIGGSNAANGYTLLTLLNNMLSQYDAWTTTPLVQMTDVTEANVLAEQSAWAKAAGSVTATETNGVVTVTNASGSPVSVPITVPPGTTVGGAAFGQPYGGELSTWTSVPVAGTTTLTNAEAPTITSANTASSIVGAPFSATVTTTGYPAPTLTETGSLPAGLTFTSNGNGKATISGTPTAGGTSTFTITAKNSTGTATQIFTVTVGQLPRFTSASSTTATHGKAFSFTVTATGYPVPTLGRTGSLPAGVTFTNNGNGRATISGTPKAAGVTTFTITATSSSGTATQAFTLTVK